MILSEYSHNKMASPCLPQSVLTPRHSVYAGYLDTMPAWHHPVKQEPEEHSVNNDSGISPSHYNSDGSVQNTSPQSVHSEARSDDSGHVDQEDYQTNATIGVLARPIMEPPHSPPSPQNASIGFLAQPVLDEQPEQQGNSLQHPMTPQQRMLPPQQRLSPLQQRLLPLQHPLSPLQQFSEQNSPHGYHQSSGSVPQNSPSGHYSPQPPVTMPQSTPARHYSSQPPSSMPQSSPVRHYSPQPPVTMSHSSPARHYSPQPPGSMPQSSPVGHYSPQPLVTMSQSSPARHYSSQPPGSMPQSSPVGHTSPQPPGSMPQSSPTRPISPQPPRSPSAPKVKSADDSSSASSVDMNYEDPLRCLQMTLQRRGMIGPLMPELPVSGEKPLKCPALNCDYATTIRSAFNNHLIAEHSEQVSCHLCEHKAENNFRLREHLQVEHNVQPDEDPNWVEDDEPGVTTPKINSQGKVKTLRCKQCGFSSVTKLEFWEHSRNHIKPGKLLTCPKCPFVTEYKHHLEYHLRNHFGSKPFKCDKCSYSCVNKSMLNSHLKSHSNVYQFRCLDCAYATKYCHSLKLHLRKYNHRPAVVLNPDGSENPLPIVDVYGTRRGPKKPKKTGEVPPSQLGTVPSLHPVFSGPYGFMQNQTIPYPYNALMNPFRGSPLITLSGNPMMQEEQTSPRIEPESTITSNVQQSPFNYNQEGVNEYLTRVISTQQDIIARTTAVEGTSQSAEPTHGAPLDLSRPEPEPTQQAAETIEQAPESSGQSSATKSRRKGKAYKLERIAQRLQQQSSDEEDTEPSPKKLKFDTSTEVKEENEQDESGLTLSDGEEKDPASPMVDFSEEDGRISDERRRRWRNVREIYDCQFCDLLFGDEIMYTMHMGYHGYQNPFTCNMCGQQTADRIQFSLHLFRHAHN